MRDPYTVLGVGRGASDSDIKKAYRRLAKENHPDRNADNAMALERFKEANSAYELLSDADRKARFDRGEIDADGNPATPFAGGFRGGAAGPGGPGAGFGGGAGAFRGGRSGGGRPGGFDFAAGADDLFAELFGGGGGAGGARQPFGGAGPRQPPAKGADVGYRLGVAFEDAATLRPQRVTLRSGRTIEVKLPPGLESGRQLRLAGQGEAGPGGTGDALVTIDIDRHRYFSRDGDDIRLALPVTLVEAVTGAKVRMPTVEGAVTLTIPAGTNSGRVFRLKGRGFSRADGSRGDQLVTVLIDVAGDDPALQAFVAGWRDERNIRADFDL